MNVYEVTQTLERFFTHDELRILLKVKLGKDMSSLSQASNFRTQVFEVTTAAEREGWLDRFIEEIKKARPHVTEETVTMSSNEQHDISTIVSLLTGAYGQDGFIQKTEKRLARIEEKLSSTTNIANSPTMLSVINFILGVIVSMGGYVVWTKFFG